MKLSEILGSDTGQTVISIAGGGGKTSTMFNLAGDLLSERVLITTTTKILRPEQSDLYDVVTEEDSDIFLKNLYSGQYKNHIVLGSSPKEYPGKLVSKNLSYIDKVKDSFRYTIIESDGSAGRPVKAPAEHEPVISEFTGIYIGLIGLDCLGKDGSDSYVHRPELFAGIRGKDQSEVIDASDLVKLINSPRGLFKNAPAECRKIALLNKCDLIGSSEGIHLVDRIFGECDFPVEVILNTYKQSHSVLFYRM